ncbi:hypothetical protein LTR35_008342 [Friedmanniomyces endolithicus]|uniref:Uncharacterized protein n=1 Tax=Friedmanniomyces endolithicus TaxID=329885 RepID=A0AAN6J7C5_9PEZI|nr:hypothetical protein LTR35_008342 [Friedmanniomyces endolithicus]KAK0296359.1 hypothetical protein LTS00_005192 [Friedmanniomyces endolithicus]KAK0319587.1 hypothetical protein LTR82_009292 [Friedmanniomyces endolithicus]KAK1004880.1 hypothetical protein LTR54_007201 [Friedmanniomyces endolithicus]
MATTTITKTDLPTQPTTLYYYLEPKDGGQIQTYPGTAAEKRRKHVPHHVQVEDMRSIRSQFTLEKTGFELIDHVSKEKDFLDEKQITSVYYPEVEELIKKKTGATKVHVVSHMCRRHTTADSKSDAEGKPDTDYVTLNNPARFVHVDQSYRGAEQILYLNMPEEEADRLTKTRWGIINVWQPFGKPVTRDPLALCDYRTVDENDFRTVVANLPPPGAGHYGNVSKNFKSKGKWEYSTNGDEAARYEVANMAYNKNQQFYYADKMTPDEAWLFKIFDSKKDGRARCAVHSSFPLDDQPEQGEARTSVEVRCFVFWEDDDQVE